MLTTQQEHNADKAAMSYTPGIRREHVTLGYLPTLLTEGRIVLLWGGYLGEELSFTTVLGIDEIALYDENGYPYITHNLQQGRTAVSVMSLYERFFDRIDRHAEECLPGVEHNRLSAFPALIV